MALTFADDLGRLVKQHVKVVQDGIGGVGPGEDSWVSLPDERRR